MLAFVFNAVLLILYASIIFWFFNLIFIHARATLMFARFVYGSVGFRFWDGLRADSPYRKELEAFQKSAPVLALKKKWMRAGLRALASFVLMFATVGILALVAPDTLQDNWMFR